MAASYVGSIGIPYIVVFLDTVRNWRRTFLHWLWRAWVGGLRNDERKEDRRRLKDEMGECDWVRGGVGVWNGPRCVGIQRMNAKRDGGRDRRCREIVWILLLLSPHSLPPTFLINKLLFFTSRSIPHQLRRYQFCIYWALHKTPF